MKKTALILALASALGSIGLGHLYLERLENQVSGGSKVSVLVASEDIGMDTPLAEKLVAVRDIPRAYVDSRHVRASDARKVLGARTSTALKANETLLWSDVAQASGQARILSGLVQRGMRAVAIETKTGNFEGLLRPGDRVDLLFTDGGKGTDPGSTVTLLQNLLVLSVGGNIGKVQDGAKRSGSSGTVTVSATVEQAQLITQAKERGRLSLTLRNSDDITLAEGLPETGMNELSARELEARAQRAARSVDGSGNGR